MSAGELPSLESWQGVADDEVPRLSSAVGARELQDQGRCGSGSPGMEAPAKDRVLRPPSSTASIAECQRAEFRTSSAVRRLSSSAPPGGTLAVANEQAGIRCGRARIGPACDTKRPGWLGRGVAGCQGPRQVFMSQFAGCVGCVLVTIRRCRGEPNGFVLGACATISVRWRCWRSDCRNRRWCTTCGASCACCCETVRRSSRPAEHVGAFRATVARNSRTGRASLPQPVDELAVRRELRAARSGDVTVRMDDDASRVSAQPCFRPTMNIPPPEPRCLRCAGCWQLAAPDRAPDRRLRRWRGAGARTTATRDVLRSKRGTRAGRWPARCTSLGASALAPLRSSPRGLQPLLLDKVHNRHDRRRLRQLDAELLHDRP